MTKSILMTLMGAFIVAVTFFAPAANAGYHHHTPHYTTYSYVYVSHCKWVKFHDHYGNHYYKKICH